MIEEALQYAADMSPIEIGAVVFGLIYVGLAAKEVIWCWPAGILASLLAMFLAYQSNYKLDVLKESYYVVMGAYGWFAWMTHRTSETGTTPVISYAAGRITAIIAAGTALSLALGYVFDQIGSDLPYVDASTTVFAFITTWLVTQKVLQNWLFWIVINAAGCYMYVRTGFYFFSLLLLIYLIVSVFGFVRWKRAFVTQDSSHQVANVPTSHP